MSLGILGRKRGLGAVDDSVKYPWLRVSQDTLELQNATNQALQAAGFCHIPPTGILDGRLCGARNHLTVKSREFFGNDMLFSSPSECEKHPDELMLPIPGCFEPTELKPGQKIGTTLTREDWILVGGALAATVAAYLMITGSGAPRAQRA